MDIMALKMIVYLLSLLSMGVAGAAWGCCRTRRIVGEKQEAERCCHFRRCDEMEKSGYALEREIRELRIRLEAEHHNYGVLYAKYVDVLRESVLLKEETGAYDW